MPSSWVHRKYSRGVGMGLKRWCKGTRLKVPPSKDREESAILGTGNREDPRGAGKDKKAQKNHPQNCCSDSMPQTVSETSCWGQLPLASRGGCFSLGTQQGLSCVPGGGSQAYGPAPSHGSVPVYSRSPDRRPPAQICNDFSLGHCLEALYAFVLILIICTEDSEVI